MGLVIGYASRTGTRRNLAALYAAGWRQLVCPGQRPTPPLRGYMLDNGAWAAHARGEPLDLEAFAVHLDRFASAADHVVAPDIVGDGRASLALSLEHLGPCLAVCARALVAVQDGIGAGDLDAVPLGDRVGLFVGGSTAWKLSTLRTWGGVARERGCWLHVGRVNTRKRIRLCQDAGVDSIDGTSASRYATTLPLLDNAIRQRHLFGSP